MNLARPILAFTLLLLTVSVVCLDSYKRAHAQVCAEETTCSSGFPESCFGNSSLPAVNIHVAGPWYTEELAGHCGAQNCYIILACPCGPPRGQRLCTSAEKGGY
jgi:hypothetical protein